MDAGPEIPAPHETPSGKRTAPSSRLPPSASEFAMNHLLECCFSLLSLRCQAAMAADHPLLPGYLDYPELTERLQSLAQHEQVRLHSLGRTTGDREIDQLTIAQGEPESRPAILIMGGLDAKRPVDSELAGPPRGENRQRDGCAGSSHVLRHSPRESGRSRTRFFSGRIATRGETEDVRTMIATERRRKTDRRTSTGTA